MIFVMQKHLSPQLVYQPILLQLTNEKLPYVCGKVVFLRFQQSKKIQKAAGI